MNKHSRDLSEPVNVVAYARVSHAREEMISPEIQLDSIRTWAAMRNRRIVAEIVDPNATGRNFDRRIQEAIQMVEAGTAEEIIVYKFSRFGRSRRGWELNFGRLEDVGGDLQSSTEEVDARTATGKLTRGVLKEIAAFESDRFSDRWKDTAHYREERGLPHTATPRFGYVHHRCTFQDITKGGWRIVHAKDPQCGPGPNGEPCKEKYRIDPATGPVLAKMYERYVAGASLQTIAEWLSKTGVPTTGGGKWRSTTVADILDSGWGAGYMQVGVQRTGDPKTKRTQRPREWVRAAHKPVIKEDLWTAYRSRRIDQRGSASRRRQKWPMSGITRCGLCDGPMTCTTGRGGPGYIMRCVGMQDSKSCPGVWRVTRDVEKAFFAALDGLADELEAEGRRVARTLREQKSDQSALRRSIEADLRKVETRRRNLIEAVMNGALTLEMVTEQRAELDADEARLTTALVEAEVPPRAWTPPQIRSLRRDWARLPLEQRREMVRLVVDRIVAHPDKRIEVHLSKALAG